MPSKPPSSEALRIERLVVDYPSEPVDLTVLSGIDLSVRRGEVLGLIGASGSGKTTLLGAIMGLVKARSGRIELGVDRVAMVFQRPQLFPWKTVLENAAYGLECRGVPSREARERAGTLLERMQLADHLRDRPHRLSEGMKQRVNLARALLVEPDLLLMDEPYSALDALTRRTLQSELLEGLRERPVTVVFASHALDEVVFLADRVAVLSGKPASVTHVVDVALPRPRDAGARGRAELWERVEQLSGLLK